MVSILIGPAKNWVILLTAVPCIVLHFGFTMKVFVRHFINVCVEGKEVNKNNVPHAKAQNKISILPEPFKCDQVERT